MAMFVCVCVCVDMYIVCACIHICMHWLVTELWASGLHSNFNGLRSVFNGLHSVFNGLHSVFKWHTHQELSVVTFVSHDHLCHTYTKVLTEECLAGS